MIATLAGWRWTFLSLAAFVPIVAVLVLPAVSRHDRGRLAPDPSIVRDRGVLPPPPIRRAASISLLGNLALYGVIAFAPLAITDVRGQSVIDSGIAIAILSVAWIAAAWVHQRYAERFEFRDSIRLGYFVMTLSLAVGLTLVVPQVPWALILLAWIIVGCGAGVAFQATNLFVFALARPGAEGRATSSVQLANTLGAAIGTFAMGVLLNAGTGAGFGLEGALSIVFAACLALMALATVIAWGLPPRSTAMAMRRAVDRGRRSSVVAASTSDRGGSVGCSVDFGRGGLIGRRRPTDPSWRGCRRRGGSARGRRSGPR